jgi:ATP-dependent DNA ligase
MRVGSLAAKSTGGACGGHRGGAGGGSVEHEPRAGAILAPTEDQALSTLTGQRSLELETQLPDPPHDLRPMLPRLARRLPADAARLVDPTWGGLRVLADAHGARVQLLVDGVDVAERFPDLVVALRSLHLRGAVLDGEIVVPQVRSRALADAMRRHRGPIRPATLVISDVLWLAGRALLGESLDRRRERLVGLGIAAPHLVALAPAAGADAVLEVAALHGLVGVVAKRADSPYLPGVRSRLWTLVHVADAMATMRQPLELGEPTVRPDIALLRTLPFGEDA